MSSRSNSRHLTLRLAVLGLTVLGASTLVELHQATSWMILGVGLHALSILAAAVFPVGRLEGPVRLSFLAGDLLAIGTLGYLVLAQVTTGHTVLLPFLAGFVVASLVAIMGQRAMAGILGAMAGVMVLGMGLLFLKTDGGVPATSFVAPQLLWIMLAATQATLITSWIARADDRKRLRDAVERELRLREAESSELFSLSDALSDSSALDELGESVLRHLRCHQDVRARAVILESEGSTVALWEEQGRLSPDDIERRRSLAQTALARAGSNHKLRRLTGRSVGSITLPTRLDFQTVVDVPVRAGGRAAGVILLADPRRGALAPERIGVLADVARRLGEALQRIERRRVGENRRMGVLLREMREGVLLLGLDGAVQLANPAANHVLSLCAEHGQADHLGEASLEDLGRTPPNLVRRSRFHLHTPEGEREYNVTAAGVADANKRIGTLVTVSDITDEEVARRRLMRAEKTTLVGQTLAGVAHELNNPLAALVGYADLIRSQDVPEKLERAVSRMCEQAVRASKIVRNLLNFARRRNPQRVPVGVSELAEAVAELFAYEARINNVTLSVDIPEGLPSILVDRHAIQQILVNLTQNAIHAMQQQDEERTLTISAKAHREEILIRVKDSGPGVPEEHRARIFQAFFTTKGAKNGTGLGLALSSTIARDHGGDLILEPYDGEGASFLLRLPVHATTSEVISDLGPADATSVPQNVLVVDDEPSVRETLVAQLGNLGSRVDSAANAAEAERMLYDGGYDVILMDVRMPGTSGLELRDRVLERRPSLASRIIFMTGDFVNDEVTSEVSKTGNLLLEKPFTMDELRTAVARARSSLVAPPVGERPVLNYTETV